MTELRIRINDDILDEMDRMVSGRQLNGRRWLQDAVAIYKGLLAERLRAAQATRRDPASSHRRPVRRQALRDILENGRRTAIRILHRSPQDVVAAR